jgi:hypothetical protein
MRRTSLVTILVFVAGLGIGYFARNAAGSLCPITALPQEFAPRRGDCRAIS